MESKVLCNFKNFTQIESSLLITLSLAIWEIQKVISGPQRSVLA